MYILPLGNLHGSKQELLIVIVMTIYNEIIFMDLIFYMFTGH